MGIDLGTGSCKVTVIDERGTLIAEASGEYPTSHPQPGYAEQDPNDWWHVVCDILKRMKAEATWEVGDIAAVALDGSTHNAVLLDKNNAVIRPVIMWTDQRSAAEAKELQAAHGKEILRIGWQMPTPTWTLPQLAWLNRHEPDTLARTAHILFVKDHVRYRMTGVAATDHIEAAGTLFFDMEKRAWSRELCDLIGLPLSVLPEIVQPTDRVGVITAEASRETGLREGTPVIAGASDSAVEAYAAGALDDGQAVIKIATAGNVNVMTSKPHPHEKTLTYPHIIPGRWYTVTATNAAGVSKRWLRDVLSGSDELSYADMDTAALASSIGANGVQFHPYLSGERSPYWDADLRASFTGLSMANGRGDIIRSLMEGVAFSLRDCSRVIDTMGLALNEIRFIGGGAKSELWRTIVADVFGRTLFVPAMSDASFGAALLAGVGVGIFPTARDAIARCGKIGAEINPSKDAHERYGSLFERYLKVHDALAPVYTANAALPANKEGA
ncbi:MAG: xylulokinase [Spirochaetota bacterium]